MTETPALTIERIDYLLEGPVLNMNEYFQALTLARGALVALASAEQTGREAAERWVSVEECLPESDVRVLVRYRLGPKPDTEVGRLLPSGNWYSAGFPVRNSDVTHWQPLPEPPKGEVGK